MALQDIRPMAYPDFRGGYLNSTDSGVIIDAADEGVACIFQAEADDTIAEVNFRIRVHTTGATLEVRLETVNASGQPSGTLLAAGASGTVTTTGVGRENCVITTPPTVSKGDFIALVIKQPAASPGNCQINCHTPQGTANSFPYVMTDLGGSGWVRNNSFHAISATIEYGTAGILPSVILGAHVGESGLTINTGTTPDERGNKFVLPHAVRVTGLTVRQGTVAADVVFTLYDSNDNELATLTVPQNNMRNANQVSATFLFDDTVTLVAGDTYRLTYKSADTNNVTMFGCTFDDAEDIGGWVDRGYVQSTSRTDDGSWTDSETTLLWMGLLIDQIDDGEGGGAGSGAGHIIGG